MSDVQSALNGARFEGFATVEETGLRGMITLRGDLGSETLAQAVTTATGANLPERGTIARGTRGDVAWMSPDELLVVVDHVQAPDVVAQLSADLAGEHALAVNVSDARAVFRIAGKNAAEVLAKLAPVDLTAKSFPVDSFRRTRISQSAGAFWKNADGSFELVCFRSTAPYAFEILSLSAATGSEVGAL